MAAEFGADQQPQESPLETLPMTEHVKRKDLEKVAATTPSGSRKKRRDSSESRRSKSDSLTGSLSGSLDRRRGTPRTRRDKRTGEARPGSGSSLVGFEAKYPVRS